MDGRSTEAILRAAGFVAAHEEALELHEFVGVDQELLASLVKRRCAGEPLAWLVGFARFCGEKVRVAPGVYVPRWQSEPLAREAEHRLPTRGVAVDLCTGSGAVALVLGKRRPHAHVVATEIDPSAAACARSNGVEVYDGDMSANLPHDLWGLVDVVTAIVPYVPTDELARLPRDVVEWEPRNALDGGNDGTTYLVQAATEAAALLRRGGTLLLELGGDQATLLSPLLARLGFRDVEILEDHDRDTRGIIGVLAERPATSRPSEVTAVDANESGRTTLH